MSKSGSVRVQGCRDRQAKADVGRNGRSHFWSDDHAHSALDWLGTPIDPNPRKSVRLRCSMRVQPVSLDQFLTVIVVESTTFLPVIPSSPARIPRYSLLSH